MDQSEKKKEFICNLFKHHWNLLILTIVFLMLHISAVRRCWLCDAPDAQRAQGVPGERADQVFQVRLLHHSPGNINVSLQSVTVQVWHHVTSLSYYKVSR